MAKFKFNLREPKGTKETPIYLIIRWNNNRLVYPTGESIHPDNWHETTQTVKSDYYGYSELDTVLSNKMAIAKNIFRRFVNDNDNRLPAIHELREALNNEFKGKTPPPAPQSFFQFFDHFIAQAPNRVDKRTKRRVANSTIQTYKNTKRLLHEYAKDKRKKLNFDNIDLDFYYDFIDYLSIEKKLTTNTIGKQIKVLKTVMNDATERGANSNLAFQSHRFTKLSEESDSIYLTENEIQEIYDLDLSDNSKLERIRDLFVVGCWTGLRFSDFSQIRPENIDGDFITIVTKKTREEVVIPIHWTVKEIMKKYGNRTENSLPPAMSNQETNRQLKLIGMMSESLKKPVTVNFTKAGLQVSKTYKKHQLLSTHTGRRSFATNLYLDGVPTVTIMKITGHRTEQAFLKYIKITPKEHAKILQLHWQKKQGLKVG